MVLEESLGEIKGEILEQKEGVKVVAGFPQNFIEIEEIKLGIKEQKIYELMSKLMTRKANFNELTTFPGIPSGISIEFKEKINQYIEENELNQKLTNTEQYEILKNALIGILQKIQLQTNIEVLAEEILKEGIGLKEIGTLLYNKQIEEIMINGNKKFVFVFHKKYGMCKTNIKLTEKDLQELIEKIATTTGKIISEDNPLLDTKLPDGSRVNATLNTIAAEGSTITIRKFSSTPLSIVQLIQNKTLTSEAAAYLWVAIEGLGIYPTNVIVTGGSNTGKTTMLNVLSEFIKWDKRIITIEDTLELDFGKRENWIRLESTPGIGKRKEITMDDLLKNALRMRPDRLVVGEVRGKEAETMFIAMDTGHKGLMGTLHSNNAREMIIRLKSNPMNVPEAVLPLLNLVIVMEHEYSKEFGMLRRVREITELTKIDTQIATANLFEIKNYELIKSDVPSHNLETMAKKTGLTKNEIKQEINVRQHILNWMAEHNLTSLIEVERIIQQYYFDPESILKQIQNTM